MSNLLFNSHSVDRIVFHYNKHHNIDQSTPTWIIKHKGVTYYVHHLDSKVGFSTKETPDSSHTKGSIQFKGKLKIIEENSIITAIIE